MPGVLTIVGLGPGDPSLRTIAAQRALDAANKIILRTAIHPGLADLLDDPRVTTCDDLYASGKSFDLVYGAIVERIVRAASEEDVVYAVPGHPLCGESTVPAIINRIRGGEIEIQVIAGISVIESVSTILGLDVLKWAVQVHDALSLAAAVEAEPYASAAIDLSPTRSCLILQVYSAAIASSVKLALSRLYPEDHRVAIVTGAERGPSASVSWCPLHEIDHFPVAHLTSLWVPPLDPLGAFRSFATLQRIIARLRGPDGCPWDREQTHESLRAALIEESYEVLDAIDGGDPDALAEELGDLLFQPIMHAQIAEEAGHFTFEDVVEHATRKLIRRHPHVFGDATAKTASDVITTWEAIKAEERQQKGVPAEEAPPHLLDRLPRSMPALARVAQVISQSHDPAARPNQASRVRLSEDLFHAVAAITRAGLDPEVELERVARRHFDGQAGPDMTAFAAPPVERS